MTTPAVPFYADWTFWAVAIAAVALVLSQLPPIHQLLRPGKLRVELYSRLAITHKVGNPNVQLHVILTNRGGRTLRIAGMSLKLSRDGNPIGILPAQNYLQQPNDQTTVLLTRFSLKSKEEWAHIVNFLKPFTRVQEKEYRAAERALKVDIEARRLLPENKDRIVAADAAKVLAFDRMFDELFVWQPGEYGARLTVEAPGGKELISANYRFTIFESDSQELMGAKAAFKTGDGIYWNSGTHPSVLIQVVEA